MSVLDLPDAYLQGIDYISHSEKLSRLPWCLHWTHLDKVASSTPSRIDYDYIRSGEWRHYGGDWGALQLMLLLRRRELPAIREAHVHCTTQETTKLKDLQLNYGKYLCDESGCSILRDILSRFPDLTHLSIGDKASSYTENFFDIDIEFYIDSAWRYTELPGFSQVYDTLVYLYEGHRKPHVEQGDTHILTGLLRAIMSLKVKFSHIDVFQPYPDHADKAKIPQSLCELDLKNLSSLVMELHANTEPEPDQLQWSEMFRAAENLQHLTINSGANCNNSKHFRKVENLTEFFRANVLNAKLEKLRSLSLEAIVHFSVLGEFLQRHAHTLKHLVLEWEMCCEDEEFKYCEALWKWAEVLSLDSATIYIDAEFRCMIGDYLKGCKCRKPSHGDNDLCSACALEKVWEVRTSKHEKNPVRELLSACRPLDDDNFEDAGGIFENKVSTDQRRTTRGS
ncbi:MAG: hypothetical protein Q9162_006817 [Coniocarpon cinnabarinum]